MQSLAGSEQKPCKIVAGRDLGIDRHRFAVAIVQHFDESHKEVQNAFSKLLNIRMLVG